MIEFSESGKFGWNCSNILGKGGSGAVVYLGWNTITGDDVAVKIYNNNGCSRKQLSAEIDILRQIQQIDHENIVKVFGIENEANQKGKMPTKTVIVMELCTGGTLLKHLSDPKCISGLQEDEVRRFMLHIYKAIKYLRDIKIYHRDIKPDNIMRCIGNDKQVCYKLIDFDSAKLIQDDETYFSLHGTEEYLDPYLYAELVTPSEIKKAQEPPTFTASTDLWSIGATLYHVVTGRLPFRPFLGRRDRKTMHFMTMKKNPGVISAYQTTKNGEIFQDKELPQQTLLSPSFKSLLRPLLSKLLEADISKRMTFDAFFAEVERILSYRLVHVFYLNRVEKVRVYLKDNTVTALQEKLEIYSKVPPTSQAILFKERNLNNLMGRDSLALDDAYSTTLPSTTEQDPLILLNIDDREINLQLEELICQEPIKLFPNQVSRRNDFSIARHNCCVAHQYSRQIDEAADKAKLLQLAVNTIHQIVTKQLTNLSWDNLQIISMAESLRIQADMMKKFHKFYNSFSSLIPKDSKEGRELENSIHKMELSYTAEINEFSNFDEQLCKLKPSIDQLISRRVESRQLLNDWNEKYDNFPAFKTGLYSVASTSLLKKACGNFRHLYSAEDVSSPATIMECSNQDQINFQVVQRIQFTKNLSQLEKQFKDCFSKFSRSSTASGGITVVDAFSDWYPSAVISFVQNDVLAKNVTNLKDNLQKCQQRLSESYKKYSTEVDNLSKIITISSQTQVGSRKLVNANVKVLRENIFELQNAQQAILFSMEKNKDLCSQLQEALQIQD